MKSQYIKILPVIFTVIFLPVLTYGCTNTPSKIDLAYGLGYYQGFKDGQDSLGKWALYTDDYTYYILAPPGWTKNERANGNVFIESSFRNDVYISVSFDQDNRNINNSSKEWLSYFQKWDWIKNTSILSDNKTTHQGYPARIIEVTWDDDLSAARERYEKVLFIAYDDETWEVSFFSPLQFRDEYQATADFILAHFAHFARETP
jgi:hypothetical protein